ncbi:isopentenyl-diphosphate Delta-isomerase [Desnuesiella massiliensis]|uniref:isopentenyl-diphosphate Delta-isomerase n=1 Tax=Desnuesiella massiliensis TaxID=1650662 RepID=UPI0006E3A538|nr:isopentenyl-diphosphate Delta-isomerase [Desnuesiella massiliensis]
MGERILLVNEYDKEVGYEEKLTVHKKGLLHRAFSIFIFDKNGRLLLQKRDSLKYHSPSLWTNTCCSHQREGELLEEAIHRRLKEEMGFDCDLKEIFQFTYKTEFKNELIENEYDHVFIGRYDGTIVPNKEEVEDFKWAHLNEIKEDIKNNPEGYTYWFKLIINKVEQYIQNNEV